MSRFLFKPIDIAPLAIFRIFFGFLLACESFGAMITGWIKKVLITPEFTFSLELPLFWPLLLEPLVLPLLSPELTLPLPLPLLD